MDRTYRPSPVMRTHSYATSRAMEAKWSPGQTLLFATAASAALWAAIIHVIQHFA